MKKAFICILLLTYSHFFAQEPKDNLFQISTIDALLAGFYEGDKKVAFLKTKGDFGLGTFNGIDGEMIIYEGIIYHVKSDGKVYQADENAGVPFASTHFFIEDKKDSLLKSNTYKQLQTRLNRYKECKNYPCAFKIEGLFNSMKVRAAPQAKKPYPPLAKHIKETQNIFNAKNIKGTLIGYYLPEYFAKLNVPGYHFHFLSDDKKFGGHVLELSLEKGFLSLDKLHNMELSLLQTKRFEKGEIQIGEKDLQIVEKYNGEKK